MLQAARALLTALAATALVGVGGNEAAAEPICGAGTVSAAVVGTLSVGPACVPYPFGVNCLTVDGGLGTVFTAAATVCSPP